YLKRLIADCRRRTSLSEPVKSGGSVEIIVDFDLNIPGYGSGRMGRFSPAVGTINDVAQTYARMAVYDDVGGWNVLTYVESSALCLDYGDIQYNITVPASHIVVGSGELLNPNEVLTKTQIERLKQAADSDETVMIRTAEEVNDEAS